MYPFRTTYAITVMDILGSLEVVEDQSDRGFVRKSFLCAV